MFVSQLAVIVTIDNNIYIYIYRYIYIYIKIKINSLLLNYIIEYGHRVQTTHSNENVKELCTNILNEREHGWPHRVSPRSFINCQWFLIYYYWLFIIYKLIWWVINAQPPTSIPIPYPPHGYGSGYGFGWSAESLTNIGLLIINYYTLIHNY